MAGDQAGDRGQDRVEVFASAEVARQGSPVLQVADAVLHADPPRRVSPAFGLVRRGDGAELLEARLLRLPSVLTVDLGRSAALAVAG